jgi:TPR repeat protein
VAATANLGWTYQNGIGVPVNYSDALRLYRKSANQGSAYAIALVGFSLEMGIGVAKDAAKAKILYEKAITTDADCLLAVVCLGMMLVRETNSLDLQKAEELFQQSLSFKSRGAVLFEHIFEKRLEIWSQEGTLDVNFMLGVIYEKGLLFTTSNKQRAIEYFFKAASNGDSIAAMKLKALNAHLT